jgi:hypothetical protein
MEAITKHSARRAAEEAVVLWSLASTQFPKNNPGFLEEASACMIEVVIPYIQSETDRRELAFIDPFALAHAYLYEVYPLAFKL